MKGRRRTESEDVLELRDLDQQRRTSMLVALVAFGLLLWALTRLAEALRMSADQQEELLDRLEDLTPVAQDRRAATTPAAASSSEAPKA